MYVCREIRREKDTPRKCVDKESAEKESAEREGVCLREKENVCVCV